MHFKSKIKVFADDTMIFSIVCDPFSSAYKLNHNWEIIKRWAYQRKIAFNPEHNKHAVEVSFPQKIKSSNHPPIFFNDTIVSKVDAHKYVGLTFDHKLSFVNNINDKIKIAKKLIGISNTSLNIYHWKLLIKCRKCWFVLILIIVMWFSNLLGIFKTKISSLKNFIPYSSHLQIYIWIPRLIGSQESISIKV